MFDNIPICSIHKGVIRYKDEAYEVFLYRVQNLVDTLHWEKFKEESSHIHRAHT